MPAEHTDSLAHGEGERERYDDSKDECRCSYGEGGHARMSSCDPEEGQWASCGPLLTRLRGLNRVLVDRGLPAEARAVRDAITVLDAVVDRVAVEAMKPRPAPPETGGAEGHGDIWQLTDRHGKVTGHQLRPPCPETGEREADPRFTPYRAYSEELAEVVRDYLAVTGEGGFDGTPRRRMRAKLDALIGTDDQAGWNARFHAVCDREWAAAVVERVAEEEAARTTEGETA